MLCHHESDSQGAVAYVEVRRETGREGVCEGASRPRRTTSRRLDDRARQGGHRHGVTSWAKGFSAETSKCTGNREHFIYLPSRTAWGRESGGAVPHSARPGSLTRMALALRVCLPRPVAWVYGSSRAPVALGMVPRWSARRAPLAGNVMHSQLVCVPGARDAAWAATRWTTEMCL